MHVIEESQEGLKTADSSLEVIARCLGVAPSSLESPVSRGPACATAPLVPGAGPPERAPAPLPELQGALASHGLAALSRRSESDLARMTGLSQKASQKLAASFQLGRLVEAERWSSGDSVRTPGGVYRLMVPRLRGLDRETFYVLLLDGRHRLLMTERISEGTLTTSLVHPREVFRLAIRCSAAAIVVVHNHPSGDPEPSRQDLDVTRRLADCGKLVGIPLLDHVVIGTGAHVSIRERMEF